MLGQHPAPPPNRRKQSQFCENITMVVRIKDEILFSQGKHEAKHNKAKAMPLILHTKFCYKDDKTNPEIFFLQSFNDM